MRETRLFPKSTYTPGGTTKRMRNSLAGLNPSVLDFRLIGLRTKENKRLGRFEGEIDCVCNRRQECCSIGIVVIARQKNDDSFGIAPLEFLHRPENPDCSSLVPRLGTN